MRQSKCPLMDLRKRKCDICNINHNNRNVIYIIYTHSTNKSNPVICDNIDGPSEDVILNEIS